MPIYLGIILFPFLLGFFLFIRGTWPKRVGDNPVCRACGYDLRGRDEKSPCCSECGAVLSNPKAIAIGHRRRKPWLILLGVGLTLIALAIGVGAMWMDFAQRDPNSIKPAWLLKWESRGPQTASRDAAIGELVKRGNSGNLSSSRLAWLVDRILQVQSDPIQKWNPIWGDFIYQQHVAGSLAPGKYQQFARQGVIFQLTVRPNVMRGDPVAYSVTSAFRFGTGIQPIWVSHSVTVNSDDLIDPRWAGQGGGSGTGGGAWSTALNIDPNRLAKLADGKHTLKLLVQTAVHDPPYQGGPIIVNVPLNLQADFKLLPAGTSTVTPVYDDKLLNQVNASIKFVSASWQIWGRGNGVNLQVSSTSPLVDLAFDVFLKSGDQEWPGSGINIAQGSTTNYGFYAQNIPDLTGQPVDLILRPRAKEAASTVSFMSFWNHEIVLKNITITGTPAIPATQPTTQGVGK